MALENLLLLPLDLVVVRLLRNFLRDVADNARLLDKPRRLYLHGVDMTVAGRVGLSYLLDRHEQGLAFVQIILGRVAKKLLLQGLLGTLLL